MTKIYNNTSLQNSEYSLKFFKYEKSLQKFISF